MSEIDAIFALKEKLKEKEKQKEKQKKNSVSSPPQKRPRKRPAVREKQLQRFKDSRGTRPSANLSLSSASPLDHPSRTQNRGGLERLQGRRAWDNSPWGW